MIVSNTTTTSARPRVRRLMSWFAALLCLSLTGCSAIHGPSADRLEPGAGASEPTSPAPAEPQPYSRIDRSDTNIVRLQISARKLVPVRHRGPSVWLVGTSHVGEPSYYQDLQKQLNARTLVLFEGINASAHKRRIGPADAAETPTGHLESSPPGKAGVREEPSIQSTLAKSLGLVFQLDAIDYDRTNFLNSDLSIQQIQRLMAGEEKSSSTGDKGSGNQSFEYLMQAMDGSSFIGSLFRLGIQFLGSSPQLQSIARLTLIEALGQINGDFTSMRGLPPDMKRLIQVLIEARNQKVVDDLKAELKRMSRSGSVAVFYGTGHMEDMEKRIVRELNYKPRAEIWLTAFSADLRKTGLSDSEVQSLRKMVKWQMDQLHP